MDDGMGTQGVPRRLKTLRWPIRSSASMGAAPHPCHTKLLTMMMTRTPHGAHTVGSSSGFSRLVIALLVAVAVTAAGVVLAAFEVLDQIAGRSSHWNLLFAFGIVAASGVGLLARLWCRAEGQRVSTPVQDGGPGIGLLQIEGPTAIRFGGQDLNVWHIWFVNDPTIRGPSATASGLTAVVEFRKSHGERPFEPFVGLWAKTQQADAMGWTDSDASRSYSTFANEIVLPPTPARAKLMLLGQNGALVTVTVHGVTRTMRDVFALPGDIVGSPSRFQYSKYRLYPDVTEMLVRLHAKNMAEQQFRFVLRRDHEGQVVSIAEIPGGHRRAAAAL
jgi:hypothetical protein